MAEKSSRGTVLTIFAVLFIILAISNFSKPLSPSARAGFVFFGVKTSGLANAILGPLFGLILVVYATGIWQMRRWAVPLGFAYASYVAINLAAFAIRNAGTPELSVGYIGYVVIALGVSGGSAILLNQRRADLT